MAQNSRVDAAPVFPYVRKNRQVIATALAEDVMGAPDFVMMPNTVVTIVGHKETARCWRLPWRSTPKTADSFGLMELIQDLIEIEIASEMLA